MGLLDELEEARDANLWKQPCGVHVAMIDHPDEADVIFTFCTLRTDKPATLVARTLEDNGVPVSYQTVQRHRGRRCKCHERMPERYL